LDGAAPLNERTVSQVADYGRLWGLIGCFLDRMKKLRLPWVSEDSE
jgi:hypothetical protein